MPKTTQTFSTRVRDNDHFRDGNSSANVCFTSLMHSKILYTFELTHHPISEAYTEDDNIQYFKTGNEKPL